MDWKGFLKPTVSKAVFTAILFLASIVVFPILYYPVSHCPGLVHFFIIFFVAPSLVGEFLSRGFFSWQVIEILYLYVVVCVFAAVDKKTQPWC